MALWRFGRQPQSHNAIKPIPIPIPFMKDYTSIGYTKKLYGIKGGIRVQIEDDYYSSFENSKVLFLNIDGRKIPFFVEHIIDAPPLRVLFEDHTDRATAQALTGKEIFLPTDQLIVTSTSPSNDLKALEGFLMEDVNRGPPRTSY